MIKMFSIRNNKPRNHENINNSPEKIWNFISFIDKYNWKEISFPLHVKD